MHSAAMVILAGKPSSGWLCRSLNLTLLFLLADRNAGTASGLHSGPTTMRSPFLSKRLQVTCGFIPAAQLQCKHFALLVADTHGDPHAGPQMNKNGVVMHGGGTILFADGRRLTFDCGFDTVHSMYLQVGTAEGT